MHTADNIILIPGQYYPAEGDAHDVSAPQMYPFTLYVRKVEEHPLGGRAFVQQLGPGESRPREDQRDGVWMPVESVIHMVNDLRAGTTGLIPEPDTKNDYVAAVARGDCEFLGKGNDGVVFKVWLMPGRHIGPPHVVKASTTCPYQPFNSGHRTPAEASRVIEDEHWTSMRLLDAGVPCILKTSLVFGKYKTYVIKPFVKPTRVLTPPQLVKIEKAIQRMHNMGLVMGDTLQVGLMDDEPYFYDLASVREDTRLLSRRSDYDEIRLLFKDSGQEYVNDEYFKRFDLESVFKSPVPPAKKAPTKRKRGKL